MADAWAWIAAGFSNHGIRNGIKVAVSCLLALFLALYFRLESPTWAVTTAFVLQVPKYVGAIAEKTLLRILGALAGAFIGYLITGSLEQNPVLFLGAMGLLLTFTTSMFGGHARALRLSPDGLHRAARRIRRHGRPRLLVADRHRALRGNLPWHRRDGLRDDNALAALRTRGIPWARAQDAGLARRLAQGRGRTPSFPTWMPPRRTCWERSAAVSRPCGG